ncbi:MAG: DMT family transporter [Candidatus Neomarinimicrobiota bacterium]
MSRLAIILLLAFGLLAVSTASIFVRLVPALPAATIAFWRMAVASTVLWTYTGLRTRAVMTVLNRRLSALAGIFLGLHFACFFAALQYTSIANATLFSAMAPFFTVLAERFILGRSWNSRIIIGLGTALVGAAIIQGGRFDFSDRSTIGTLLGLGAAVLIALVLLLTERIRRDTGSLVFSRSLYLAGGLTMLVFTGLSGGRLLAVDPSDYLWLVLLGVVPTVFGHTSFYHAVKFVRPSVVAAVPLGEPLVASALGWFLLGEAVPLHSLVGGVITLAGLFLLINQPRLKIES